LKNTSIKSNIILLLFFFTIFSWSQNPVTDSLKKIIKTTKIDTSKVNTLNVLANEFVGSHPDSTTFYSNQALSLARKSNFIFGMANASMNKGNANIMMSQYKKALVDFNEAQKHYENLLKAVSDSDIKKVKNGLARAYASAGVVYSEVNNYAIALHYYLKALKIYQEIDQKNSISKAYNNIAIVYKSQGNLPKALDYLQRALQIQKQIEEPTFGVTLMNIGVVYFEQGDMRQAFTYYSQAQQEFKKAGNERNNALLQNYWGDYFKKQNNTEQAFRYYELALTMYEAIDNSFGASLALFNLGQLNFDLKKYNDALTYTTKSLVLAKAIGVIDQRTHSEKLLSDIYSAMQNPTESLLHYKAYINAKDSLNNEENNKKFLRSEMNFEYQKREALLLEKNKNQQQLTWFAVIAGLLLLGLIFVTYNRLQIKRRLTLQKEVAEYEQKALHLQMNPHFVFNCLGSISSFIVQNGTDSAIKYLSKFSKLMRLTLEYSKGSLIPIDKEIESLQNYLELEQLRFNNKFEFRIHSSSSIEDDMALPPLLVQPFVENAILHGIVPKEGDGRIEVNFNVISNQLICTITDDGIGLSKSKAIKENSVKAHQSMALEITKKRLEMMENSTQQKAHVTMEEVYNIDNQIIGTKVIITLPIQYTLDTKPRI
jgi:tetratricopeptide (TPR) repeat protein